MAVISLNRVVAFEVITVPYNSENFVAFLENKVFVLKKIKEKYI
jgi:hypothetical protein